MGVHRAGTRSPVTKLAGVPWTGSPATDRSRIPGRDGPSSVWWTAHPPFGGGRWKHSIVYSDVVRVDLCAPPPSRAGSRGRTPRQAGGGRRGRTAGLLEENDGEDRCLA